MNKETINKAHIDAIKAKDVIAKALFSTFKGALDNELKNGSTKSEKEIIETIAKKFTENAKIMNTAESIQEIELLKQFLPAELEPQAYNDAVNFIAENNLGMLEEIKNGKGAPGKLVGLTIAKLKKDYPGLSIDPKIVTELFSLIINN